jgi:hypothetical protein
LVEVVLDATDAPLNVRLCGAAIDEFNKKSRCDGNGDQIGANETFCGWKREKAPRKFVAGTS